MYMLRKVSFSARLGKVLGFNSLAIPYLKKHSLCCCSADKLCPTL